ncbi:hypothetical protein CASFOL_036707 [Castilleja foliolosa]|uniref:Receptor-like serine/threonine-protein kinase n=1 Tax=Castilleja foliolosa TaxID=1961234 RepID=A0ABD3BPE4_9LAMI
MLITTKLSNLCILITALFLLKEEKVCGVDTLSRGQSLTPTQTLISKADIFELGFFTPNKNTYLGIWYKDFPEKTIVWVANRQSPLLSTSSNSRISISPNGDLELSDDLHTFWSTHTNSAHTTPEAVLLDNGNLVLRDASEPSNIFWQSFDHPTDTWLPGQSIGLSRINGQKKSLVSWQNRDDPSPGMFSLEVSRVHETRELFMMWNYSRIYWKSGAWNGAVFGSVPELSYFLSFDFVDNENESYYSYSVLNNDVFSRLTTNTMGQLEQLTSLKTIRSWSPTHSQPKFRSKVLGLCGKFGFLRDDPLTPECMCLRGFNRSSHDWSRGCSRTTPLWCRNSNNLSGKKGKEDGFLEIGGMKLHSEAIIANDDAKSGKGCELACLESCSCTAYAFGESGCSVWEGDLFGLENVSVNNEQRFYLRLASTELPKGKKQKILEVIVGVLVPSVVLVSGGVLGCFYTRRRKQKEKKEPGEDILSFDFEYSVRPNEEVTMLRKRNNMDFDLPIFSYASVCAATNTFSPENKLGEGGFGPVYKGKLMNGQEIALKRLSKKSGQGIEEFRNEIVLIAKLQHRNLVRLLGCCIDTNESILIYEYMPNKSLDFFLFDSNKQELLDWNTRVRIVEGIAQGLLYLHEYSRLKIIHRDLKASNILLDDEMNPKISDFGMARIFGGNDSRTHTNRIVGTYGYMAPEYAMQGLFSIKSDVFSFGVLVLEIVSGKKNTGFYNTHSLNLLGHAWELWISGRGMELMDPAVGTPAVATVVRYVNLGLLCVQENPNDRPNMSSVISMLGNEIAPLPAPKQPAFSITKHIINSASSEIINCSVNGLTESMIQPR